MRVELVLVPATKCVACRLLRQCMTHCMQQPSLRCEPNTTWNVGVLSLRAQTATADISAAAPDMCCCADITPGPDGQYYRWVMYLQGLCGSVEMCCWSDLFAYA